MQEDELLELNYHKPVLKLRKSGMHQKIYAIYMENVFAYLNNTKIKDPFTGQDFAPNEKLMRSIEQEIEIGEQHADDFRRSICAAKNGIFDWMNNPELKKAIDKKVAKDNHDVISRARGSSFPPGLKMPKFKKSSD